MSNTEERRNRVEERQRHWKKTAYLIARGNEVTVLNRTGTSHLNAAMKSK